VKKVLRRTRRLCDGMKGQNYWFNGCMEFLMERLGEGRDYDYWFFSNVTGDSLTQPYSKDIRKTAWCPSHNLFGQAFAQKAFDACGYEFEYAAGIDDTSRDAYLPKIRQYIGRGIPVLARGGEKTWEFCLICGYRKDTLYYLRCDQKKPRALPNEFTELIFVGTRKPRPTLAQVYKQTVLAIPSYILRPATAEYSFGRQAFADWAGSFQNSTFDDVPPGEIEPWNVHGTYLCMAGTNGCAESCLRRALERNPGMAFINDLLPLYARHQEVFHGLAYRGANGKNDYASGGLCGGFKITPETIRDKALMRPVSEKIMESVRICDEILAVFERGMIP